jgi:hypothetical protein
MHRIFKNIGRQIVIFWFFFGVVPVQVILLKTMAKKISLRLTRLKTCYY